MRTQSWHCWVLWSWGKAPVHEVKVLRLLYAQLLQLQHQRCQADPLDLWHSGSGQGLKGLLSVQSEGHAGALTPCSMCALLIMPSSCAMLCMATQHAAPHTVLLFTLSQSD